MSKMSEAAQAYIWTDDPAEFQAAKEAVGAELKAGGRPFFVARGMTGREQRAAGLPKPSERQTDAPKAETRDDRLAKLEARVDELDGTWTGTAWDDEPNEIEQAPAVEPSPAQAAYQQLMDERSNG